MFALVIDTSSAAVVAGVVTLDDARSTVVADRAPIAARGHGELLATGIADCLDAAGLTPRDLDAVVAGDGPGPYTSLRIGLVTAAAFAHAVDVPTYGVCSLDAIAARDALVVTDARRREVYWARYDELGHRVDGPRVAPPADVPLDGVTAVAGAGVDLYPDTWSGLIHLPARYPTVASLAARAADRIRAGAPSEVLTPRYLRHADAVVPGAPKTVLQ